MKNFQFRLFGGIYNKILSKQTFLNLQAFLSGSEN